MAQGVNRPVRRGLDNIALARDDSDHPHWHKVAPMARNKLAGKSTGKSKSAKYYAANPEARAKKDAYNTKYHATSKRIAYRSGLNKANRASPNTKGQDKSHTKTGRLVNESRGTNRARNRGRR